MKLELFNKDVIEIVVGFFAVFIPLLIFVLTILWQKGKEKRKQKKFEKDNIHYFITLTKDIIKSIERQIVFFNQYLELVINEPLQNHQFNAILNENLTEISSRTDYKKTYFSLLHNLKKTCNKPLMIKKIVKLFHQLDFIADKQNKLYNFIEKYNRELESHKLSVLQLNEAFVNDIEFRRREMQLKIPELFNKVFPHFETYYKSQNDLNDLNTLNKDFVKKILNELIKDNYIYDNQISMIYFQKLRLVSNNIEYIEKLSNSFAKDLESFYINKYSETKNNINDYLITIINNINI